MYQAFQGSNHEVIRVGRKSGDFKVQIEDASDVAKLFKSIGRFDALTSASGEVAFTPLTDIKKSHWDMSLHSKLLGQINLVQEALPFINERGSFTLISGILGDEQIAAGTIAATVNSALEGFVKSAAYELPKALRINIVSPTLLADSVGTYGDFFPGFIPVDGEKVGLAFKKSILGIQTGQMFRVR